MICHSSSTYILPQNTVFSNYYCVVFVFQSPLFVKPPDAHLRLSFRSDSAKHFTFLVDGSNIFDCHIVHHVTAYIILQCRTNAQKLNVK